MRLEDAEKAIGEFMRAPRQLCHSHCTARLHRNAFTFRRRQEHTDWAIEYLDAVRNGKVAEFKARFHNELERRAVEETMHSEGEDFVGQLSEVASQDYTPEERQLLIEKWTVIKKRYERTTSKRTQKQHENIIALIEDFIAKLDWRN